MQYVKVKRSWMVSMADALRTANGSSDLMYPSQMLAAALAIEGGGTGVTIDKSLSKSGAAADAAAVGAALEKKADTTDIPAVPTALKNPYALTFTGAATGTYDGSEAMTVNIPTSSGSDGGLVAQIAGGSSDTSVADIKAAYDAGQAVYVYSVDDDYYATLQAATSKTAVFVSVDTATIKVITVDASDEVSVVSKTLASGSGGSDVSLAVEGNKYTLTIDGDETSWTIPTVPTALKNPYALTFAGGATGTYDGSTAKTINIPEAETAVAMVNTDGNITAEEIYNLSDGTYWFAQKFEQSLWSGTGTSLNVSLNTLLVGLVVKVGAVCYCQTTGYAVEIDPGQKKQPGQVSGVEIAAHPNSGVRVTGWPTTEELPTVTTSDAGKILMVNDSGVWAATEITNAEEVAY